ncbi:MAG: hypothetical protein LBL81_06980 [Tannerella sp.]|jgi:predicted  nucleic acid-binding Zn-ribbon protein|nr:hypothetical protein [Tannerella sp.]
MTEEEGQWLAVLGVRIHDLLRLCDERGRKIDELDASLKAKEEELRQAKQNLETWETKYKRLVTAQAISAGKTDLKGAKKRLADLVKEVDKCIAVLNG